MGILKVDDKDLQQHDDDQEIIANIGHDDDDDGEDGDNGEEQEEESGCNDEEQEEEGEEAEEEISDDLEGESESNSSSDEISDVECWGTDDEAEIEAFYIDSSDSDDGEGYEAFDEGKIILLHGSYTLCQLIHRTKY